VAWIGAAGRAEHIDHERLKVYPKGMPFATQVDLTKAILIMSIDFGIQIEIGIGIGIGIDGKDGNSTPIPIAISISTGRMRS